MKPDLASRTEAQPTPPDVAALAAAPADQCVSILDSGPTLKGRSYFLSDPTLHTQVRWNGVAHSEKSLRTLLRTLESSLQDGASVAVLALSYEAGLLLQASGLGPAHAAPLLRGLRHIEPGRVLADLAVYPAERAQGQSPHLAPPCPTAFNFRIEPLEPALNLIAYAAAVESARSAIEAGDVYQLNLVNAYRAQCSGDPGAVFLAARKLAPTPYLALLNRPGLALVSLSPERFLEREGDTLRAAPIKGTSPRSADPRQDENLRATLEHDEKNRAENIMITDLFRNDLGRLAVTGTVRTPTLARAQSFPTVHHLVSEVEATLRPGLSLHEILQATFPSGSITGAPKLRAMELIAELEPAPRGFSMGAIGVFRSTTSWEMSVAIRTLEIRGDQASFPVGGAITWDSNPEGEWQECNIKRRALELALEASR